ncbi:MAG: TIGR02302 family protein [Beijerinckiaceae bacterium]|nr:TIGR02302 family protein [Beijerinckiaceae bacterium]
MRQGRSPRGEAAANSRLEHLIGLARAILLFERAWRVSLPPLVVLGAFVCISWTGLWLDMPHWARVLGVLTLALGVAAALLPLRGFRWPSRKEALDRIDRISGLVSRPAAVIDDRLANGANDAATVALWNLHRRRAENSIALLRTGGPSPRIADLDRFALRAVVVIALFATGFVAGPDKYARVAAAFDWHLGALREKGSRIDAWIDPPAYTGRLPVLLSLGAGSPQQIEAPIGSIVVIHAPGGSLDMELKGALAKEVKDSNSSVQGITGASIKPGTSGGSRNDEIRLVLRGDATLTLRYSGRQVGEFEFHAILDRAPSIALTGVPEFNRRGSFALKYSAADDYAVTSAEARFAKPVLPGGRPGKRSLVDSPRVPLLLPLPPDLAGEAETNADLSDHPWAGARVEMTLSARDDAGNEGATGPIEITLPQKPFVKPLARALAEQRRTLVLAPDDTARVASALDALMIAPEVFGTEAGVYLGLRVAFNQLSAAQGDSDLKEVADLLWQMAMRIESGDLSEAERDLRAAEQQLREAMQRGAPEEEIRKLADNLRAAMDKFLRELAAQQKDAGRHDESAALHGEGRWIRPKELQKMLDDLQEALRSGETANAQKLLEKLQGILENLRVARPRRPDPRAREVNRALDELGRLSQEQQDLRDETYQNGKEERQRQRKERGEFDLPDQQTLADIFGHGGGEDFAEGERNPRESDRGNSGKSPATGQNNSADLGKRQKVLRDKVENLQNRLDDAGAGSNDLGGAQEAMREAETALRKGPQSNGTAVDAQGRAVEALREGAQKLADSMSGQGDGADAGGEEGQGSPGQFGAADGDDPLGRPAGRDRRVNNAGARFDPMGVPAKERARRVLDELRRRLGEPDRPREETDYLQRLLRRY